MKRLLWVICVLVLVPVVARANDDPATARGFKANAVYDSHDIDSVNAMNGTLSVHVPIGGRYPSNGTLSYQFMLSYSSNLWDWRSHSGVELVSLAQFGDVFGGGVDNPPAPSTDGLESFPARAFNAGIGWMVSLGEVRETVGSLNYQYEYISEDGAGHPFYATLHGDSPLPAPAGTDVFYTHDSTYIRMLVLARDAQRRPISFEVQLPDGIHKRFVRYAWPGDSELDHRFLLTSIADPFGNVLYVERSTPPGTPALTRPPVGSTWVWTYKQATLANADRYANPDTDSLSPFRTHVLTYAIPHWYELQLSSVQLATAGGPATYQFTYDPASVLRAMNSNWGDPGTQYVPFDSQGGVATSLLRQIDLPGNGGSWAFRYYERVCRSGSGPCYQADAYPYRWSSTFTYSMSNRSGRLAEVDLPTGGAVSYEYDRTAIPTRGCNSQQQAREGLGVSTVGVSQRTVWKHKPNGSPSDATNIDGEWRYVRTPGAWVALDGSACKWPKEFLAATIDPQGTVALSFFSTYISDPVNPAGGWTNPRGWDVREWGLPFSRYESDNAGAFVSQQTFACGTAFPETLSASDLRDGVRNLLPRYASTTTCGAPVRSYFVRYDLSSGFDCSANDSDIVRCTQPNSRAYTTVTRYDDDGSPSARPMSITVSDVSSFDGFGHYRSTFQTSTNFHFASPRTEITNWNPRGDSPNWILNVYDKTVQTEAIEGSPQNPKIEIRKTAYTFDETTGWLKQKHVFATNRFPASSHVSPSDDPVAESINDVVETYDRCRGAAAPCSPAANAASVVIREQSSGGDGSRSTTAGAEFQRFRQLQYGGQAALRYENNGSSLVVETNTVDPASGAVLASTDTAGLTTRYSYDALGRITGISYDNGANTSVAAGAATTINYYPPDDTISARVTVDRGSFESSEYRYDHLGRLNDERHQIPQAAAGDPQFSQKTRQYDPLGRTTFESTVAALGDTPSGTQYDYTDATTHRVDPFGRPHRMTLPDHKTIDLTYNGVQVVKRLVRIASGDRTLTDAASWTHYDALGRLRRTEEYDAPGSLNTTPTDYTYDAGGELAVVDMAGQKRRFDRDGRGLVTSETMPELDHSVGYRYDSMGHPLEKNYGGTDFDLAFTYDVAGRPLTVYQLSSGNPLKAFDYYATNNACGENAGFANGKLYSATRYNYIRDPHAWSSYLPSLNVTEVYKYNGTNGARSDVETRLGRGEVLRTSFGYDAAGELTSIQYPKCVAGCTAVNARSVTMAYDHGRLTSVNGFASLRYFPNGMMSRVIHANGVHDVEEIANGMPRPAALYTENVAGGANWNAPDALNQRMNYSYDGAGNIAGIQRPSGVGDWYAYDRVGRLIKANIAGDTPSAGGGITQDFAYDTWGNLLSTTTSGDPAPSAAAVNSATNRLANGTYDAMGNLTSFQVLRYEYDALGDLTFLRSVTDTTPVGKIFVYGPSDDRIGVWNFRTSDNTVRELWSLRGNGGEVLRDFEKAGDGAWTWSKDTVYRGPAQLATISAAADGTVTHHLTIDHLGSPRIVTDASGHRVGTHILSPFGRELTTPSDGERLLFTGHERDENDPRPGTQLADMDYMHARYYAPVLGRFLSVDPVLDQQFAAKNPQAWSRYSYVRNNPFNKTDLTGKCEDPGGAGTRLCIATFIPQKTFGGFKGDNRGPNPTGGTFRTQQTINVTKPSLRGVIKEKFTPGVSVFGSKARQAEVAGQEVSPSSKGIVAKAQASDGLLYGVAPNLEYDLTFEPTGDGGLKVTGTHTAFPSLEVWRYEDGKVPQLLYHYDASGKGFMGGLIGINQTIEVPEDEP
ncbi:MAG: hypothetical protein JO197_12865 [Acidobacteria bacterium]|nr:hypothetical protein [Acidobacteriota bacterium]MBV9478239.1 hypothetical protein [Acidobacteriota bacterium]